MTLLRFVLHEEIPAYEAEGWVVSSDMAGSYHGGFSVLMEKADLENVSQDAIDAGESEAQSN